jgi:signal transduction histidine kinase
VVFGGPASGTLAIAVDAEGDIVGPRPADPDGLPVEGGVEAALSGGRDVREASIGDTPVRVLSQRVQVGGEPYVIQVAQDRTAEERTLRTLLIVLVAGGLVVLAAAAGFGFLYAGRALVPIQDSLRRQREFAADASHELRTPLAVVHGSVEHLRRNADRPVREVGTALDDIDGEVRHLTSLVDDLLLLARSDSGTVELRREAVDLAEAAGEALAGLRGLAQARGLRLQMDAAPVTVPGDPDRLRQLVAILVDNAIRHSPPNGTVTVTVGHGSPALLTVDDEGAGIRAEDLPKLFDRFWRAADAPPGGTGLGLSIARWITEHHGGTISAANRPGGGARFEVRLPSG